MARVDVSNVDRTDSAKSDVFLIASIDVDVVEGCCDLVWAGLLLVVLLPSTMVAETKLLIVLIEETCSPCYSNVDQVMQASLTYAKVYH